MCLKQKAIDAVFQIMENRKKAQALDDFHEKLGLRNDDFSYGCFLNTNELALVNILDWYFYELTGLFHPDNCESGGLASYALWDAATPYIEGTPYYLKDRFQFEQYINELTEKK